MNNKKEAATGVLRTIDYVKDRNRTKEEWQLKAILNKKFLIVEK